MKGHKVGREWLDSHLFFSVLPEHQSKSTPLWLQALLCDKLKCVHERKEETTETEH